MCCHQIKIAVSLAALSLLKVFLCHLDFEAAPDPIDGDHGAFISILQNAADACARLLAPSVEFVGFLRRRAHGNKYVCFRIIHDEHGHRRAERVKSLFEIDGIP